MTSPQNNDQFKINKPIHFEKINPLLLTWRQKAPLEEFMKLKGLSFHQFALHLAKRIKKGSKNPISEAAERGHSEYATQLTCEFHTHKFVRGGFKAFCMSPATATALIENQTLENGAFQLETPGGSVYLEAPTEFMDFNVGDKKVPLSGVYATLEPYNPNAEKILKEIQYSDPPFHKCAIGVAPLRVLRIMAVFEWSEGENFGFSHMFFKFELSEDKISSMLEDTVNGFQASVDMSKGKSAIDMDEVKRVEQLFRFVFGALLQIRAKQYRKLEGTTKKNNAIMEQAITVGGAKTRSGRKLMKKAGNYTGYEKFIIE